MRKNIGMRWSRALRSSASVLAVAAIFACMAACAPARGDLQGAQRDGLFHREARTLPLTPGMTGNLAGLYTGG